MAYTNPPKSSKKNSAKISSQCRRTFLSKITVLAPAAATLTFSNEASAAVDEKDNNNDMTVSNYIRQVFGSPLVGTTPNNTPAIPVVTDDTINTREERNRAYDEAFQQDARNLDAYYGQMAMKKRQETNQNIKQYRESLGLDGKGDVRMRVGEERVQGLASLRELKADYLSSLEQEEEQQKNE